MLWMYTFYHVLCVCVYRKEKETEFSIASNDDDLVDGNGAHNIAIIIWQMVL